MWIIKLNWIELNPAKKNKNKNKNFSTEQAILELTDKLKDAIDKKELTCGIFSEPIKSFLYG